MIIEDIISISKRDYLNLLQIINAQAKQIDVQAKVIKYLKQDIRLLKNGRNSNTSSTPSSQDFSRSNKHNSRKKTGRSSGGQKGHKGSTLKMVETPDEIKKHQPDYCSHCGEAFEEGSEFELQKRRQEVVIQPIVPKYIEHQSFSCTCQKCGKKTTSQLPSHLRANVQYGKNIQSLIAYLSVFQYLPSNRIKVYMKDVMGLEMSEGTIYNFLKSMSQRAEPVYQTIKERLFKSPSTASL